LIDDSSECAIYICWGKKKKLAVGSTLKYHHTSDPFHEVGAIRMFEPFAESLLPDDLKELIAFHSSDRSTIFL
jgi:hypothetical protein